MKPVRVNILALALLGALFVVALAFSVPSESRDTVMALAGTFVGGVVGIMIQLSTRDPDPEVPASAVAILMDAGEAQAPPVRSTKVADIIVLLLALLGAAVTISLTFLEVDAMTVTTVAGGFVGGVVSLASKRSEPVPEPMVPASIVKMWLEQRVGAAIKQTE